MAALVQVGGQETRASSMALTSRVEPRPTASSGQHPLANYSNYFAQQVAVLSEEEARIE